MGMARPLSRVSVRSDGTGVGADLLHETISSLSTAAERGQQVLFAEARFLLRNLIGADDVRIVVHSGGAWREWDQLDASDEIDPLLLALPETSTSWDDVVVLNGVVFAPVKAGSVALIIGEGDVARAGDDLLRTACHVLKLALGACESRQGNPDKLEAIKVFQRVANRILKSRDLQEILLEITHEAKIRLSADICGIMLKEQDWLIMKRCVGNLAVETATLRMRAGQGVGGRVLETREPCSIEDYLQSRIISHDFFDLARAERVRSALAVPLISKDEVTGVLEVWRRRPSTFTLQHTAELATLANLASLAIENVSLAQAREAAVAKLEEAHAELQQRYDVIRASADFQESLISALLAGGGLAEIAGKAYEHLKRPVLFLDAHLDLQVCHPPEACPEALAPSIKSAILRGAGSDTRLTVQTAGAQKLMFQRVTAASEHLGWIVVLRPDLETGNAQLAVTEICVTIALHQMKARAAARALSDKLAHLMWDLLEGPDHMRRLALERARELSVDFPDAYCVMVCAVDGLDRPDAAGQLTGRDMEVRRRSIAETPGQLPGAHRHVRLSALRGSELAIVCAHRDGGHLKALAADLIDEIGRRVPGTSVRVGISKASDDPLAMPLAWRDAKIALEVARQTGRDQAVGFGDVGVAGLLMSMREGADFTAFVEEKLGRLLDEKPVYRDKLLKTLGAFFAADCLQHVAAKRLRIHEKTMAYRLGKIERITGLDLGCHEQRVLLYLALRMHDILA
jgi:sugar diacid utilization regulator/putative methionine-R-sulfoxide reductase with GAF domain